MVVGVFLLLAPRLLIDQIHLGVAPDVAPAHLRHLDRHRRLHRDRDHLQHGRGGRRPGQRRAQGHQLRAGHRARGVHRHVARRPLGHAGEVQRAAGEPGPHMTIVTPVVPGEPKGTYVLASDPFAARSTRCRARGERWVIAGRQRRRAPSTAGRQSGDQALRQPARRRVTSKTRCRAW